MTGFPAGFLTGSLTSIRLVFVLAFAAVITGCGASESEQINMEGVVQLSEQFTGDFALIDKSGAPVTDEDFEGKIMLVYFGFTHCPDVCPGDVNVMSAALNELGKQANEVAPIFISVDPERDTPQVLNDYFAFDERIIPLTGTIEAAQKARTGFKLYAKKEVLPDSALKYTINHQQAFFITDRDGQPQIAILGGSDPQTLSALLRRSIKG
ncbi:MAG: photosynthetic protein synthase I [Hyphococcus sp.]|nr:MAG: photosynthetic protein synthase I [Marinicaulis sp.]